jgi:hypothetical protein
LLLAAVRVGLLHLFDSFARSLNLMADGRRRAFFFLLPSTLIYQRERERERGKRAHNLYSAPAAAAALEAEATKTRNEVFLFFSFAGLYLSLTAL